MDEISGADPAIGAETEPHGLSRERLFTETLAAMGYRLETSSRLDTLLKTDVLVRAGNGLVAPIHIQFTTIRDHLPKMEQFHDLRVRRKELGVYVEAAETDPVFAGRYVGRHVLSRVNINPKYADSVLFAQVRDAPNRCPLEDAIQRVQNQLDARGMRTDRVHGTIVGVLIETTTPVAVIRGDDGVEYRSNLKSCTHRRLYAFLCTARWHPNEMLAWNVRVSFLPHTDHAQMPRGFALRFADDTYGRWFTRIQHEVVLLGRLGRLPKTAWTEHSLRLVTASKLVLKDLLMEGVTAGYHIPDLDRLWS